jgi:ABC-type multidrug transport system ATPase subunit
MRVLSGRLSGQLQINGNVYLNGKETNQIERTETGIIGHVEQEELFVETMTLEEHLIFQVNIFNIFLKKIK